jgi:3-oxoacyl-[acyl-carrier-protein] synthase II
MSCGMTGDAINLVMPDPDGNGAYASMKMAVEHAGLHPDDVNYVNAHGTSTPLGDIAESTAIHRLLGDRKSNVCVGSTKSMLGHLLGAAAGIEAILCALSIRDNVIPANINLDEKDPKVPLNCINTEVMEQEVTVALSNSFGFGGHNSTLVLKQI